jgi:hypothetical protein
MVRFWYFLTITDGTSRINILGLFRILSGLGRGMGVDRGEVEPSGDEEDHGFHRLEAGVRADDLWGDELSGNAVIAVWYLIHIGSLPARYSMNFWRGRLSSFAYRTSSSKGTPLARARVMALPTARHVGNLKTVRR